MHKIILTLLLLTAFSFAEKSYSFFGGQTSLVNYENTSLPSVGLKYGIQRGMWRSTFNIDYSKNSTDTLNSFILQIDKGIFQKATKNSALKPHVGFSFGVLQHEGTQKDKGYAFGINSGITYLLSDAIDLDLSYRYMSTKKMTSISSLNSLILSLHYFY